MATHNCVLNYENNRVVTQWSKGAFTNMQVGDTLRFTSKYGRVRLDFDEDCPFLPEKPSGGTVAFFLEGDATLKLKIQRIPRKRVRFICSRDTVGPIAGWPKNGGSQIPPSDPPTTP